MLKKRGEKSGATPRRYGIAQDNNVEGDRENAKVDISENGERRREED